MNTNVVGGKTRLDSVIDDLSGGASATARPGKVASPEGTILPIEERIARGYINADHGELLEPDVDSLFGSSKAYLHYKSEQPRHRLILWYKLQSFDNKEIAKLTRYSSFTVCQVVKQERFQKAFVTLAAEMGKDAIQTFLEGEVMPALIRTTELARNGESDQVRLAANREILDRFLGKSVAKTEVKSSGVLDVNVYDAAKLQEEFLRNQEILKGRGIGAN